MLLPRVLACTRSKLVPFAARHSVTMRLQPAIAVHNRFRLLSTDSAGKATGSEPEVGAPAEEPAAEPAAEPTKDAPEAGAAEAAAEGAEDAPSPEVVINTLEARVAELDKQLGDKHDQVLRALAEADNARRRASLDVENAHKFGVQKFAKDLLDVADNLSRAADSVPEDLRASEEQPVLKALYDGVVMTDAALLKTFAKHGLTRLEPLGEKFDPNFHDALFEAPDPTKEPGTVMHVATPGYVMHDRCVRAAGVGVVAKP